MSFEHACFISYCHDEGKVMTGFMKQLEDALNSTLALYLKNKKVYIDEKLLPGADPKKKLAKAICQSICMVVVYSPSYEESDFCMQEFSAMEVIEKKRTQLLGKSVEERMIIPIVLRGENDLPPKIKEMHYIDFSKVSLSFFLKDIFSNEKIIDEIEGIVKTIYINYENFKQTAEVFSNCDSFSLPSLEEIGPWREDSKKPVIPYPKM